MVSEDRASVLEFCRSIDRLTVGKEVIADFIDRYVDDPGGLRQAISAVQMLGKMLCVKSIDEHNDCAVDIGNFLAMSVVLACRELQQAIEFSEKSS